MTAPPRLSALLSRRSISTRSTAPTTRRGAWRGAGAAEGTLVWARGAERRPRPPRAQLDLAARQPLCLGPASAREGSAAAAAQLGFAAALAIADAVAPLLPPGVAVGLKWPNDVLLDGQKLAGILLELRRRATAASTGWSSASASILPRIRSGTDYPATSLAATGAAVTPEAMLERARWRLLGWYALGGAGGLCDRCARPGSQRAQGLGEPIRVRLPCGDSSTAASPGSTSDGALLLDGPDGRAAHRRRRGLSGRVSVRGVRHAARDQRQQHQHGVRRLGRRPRSRARGAPRPTPARTADEYVVWLDHLLGAGGTRARSASSTARSSPASCPTPISICRRLCREYCASEPLMRRRARGRARHRGAGRPAGRGRRRPAGQHDRGA